MSCGFYVCAHINFKILQVVGLRGARAHKRGHCPRAASRECSLKRPVKAAVGQMSLSKGGFPWCACLALSSLALEGEASVREGTGRVLAREDVRGGVCECVRVCMRVCMRVCGGGGKI